MTICNPAETDRLIDRYSAPVPRYTSYPTAPHFHDGVGPQTFAGWLPAIGPETEVSLYLHIPYCDTLCWFCGCHTKITRKYEPIAAYLEALEREIDLVSGYVTDGARVTSIHWGGGSPTILTPEDMKRLANTLRRRFDVTEDAEFAIEIDPRGLDLARVEAMADMGVNRASIGVQDFDLKVQAAINRNQSFDETRQAVEWLRACGISRVNLDAMFGLPHQTLEAVERTVDKLVRLDPDRIALFGYAHVPWLKRHQSMIDEAALPNVHQRYRQSERAGELLCAAGYRRIGLDHFARPDDSLAQAQEHGDLRRNFQGYTSDDAHALIGFGASAISCLPQGYCQNATPIADYRRSIGSGCLATAKGVTVDREDLVRRWVIEQIMCGRGFSAKRLRERFGSAVDGILTDVEEMSEFETDGLVERTNDGFRLTEAGRPFVRAVCAHFDTYFQRQTARHSKAV